MFRSVRFRLTVWYVGILALVLIGLSAGVYARLSHDAYTKLDSDLDAAITVLEQSVRHEFVEHGRKEPAEASLRLVMDMVYRNSFPAGAAAIYEGSRLVVAKPGASGVVPTVPAEHPETTTYKNTGSADSPWRLAYRTMPFGNKAMYTLVAESSLLPVLEDLRSLRRAFYLAIPLALAAAAIAGYLLARKSLAPVVAMSSTVNQISSKNLNRRVGGAEARDELGTLAATFNQLLDRIEQSFENQKQFMADSSHELRTPLYVAHSLAEVTLGSKDRPVEEYRDALATIDEQLMRLSRIVEDMFTLALADTGAYRPEIADFYLDEVVTETIRAARVLGERKHISVSASALPEFPYRGDEGLIRQLLLLLLDNAVKYTPEFGSIQVRFDDLDATHLRIDIHNTGDPIPEEHRQHIFDRFYRLNKKRSRSTGGGSGGAGLGLAIARWITELHGGTLTLTESGPNGNVFRVALPKVPTPVTQPA
ncbi:MAG: ATP-binding protein [Bryobacteraceae bacterium]